MLHRAFLTLLFRHSVILLGGALLAVVSGRADAQSEVTFPAADFAKLDTFESLNLEDADKLFAKGGFKGAFAAYKAHSTKFTRSAALSSPAEQKQQRCKCLVQCAFCDAAIDCQMGQERFHLICVHLAWVTPFTATTTMKSQKLQYPVRVRTASALGEMPQAAGCQKLVKKLH